jgi:hypothetical protein
MENELELLQRIFMEIEVRESERDQLYALLDDVVKKNNLLRKFLRRLF